MSQPDIHRYFRHGTLPQLALVRGERAARELHASRAGAAHGAAHGLGADQEALGDRRDSALRAGGQAPVPHGGRPAAPRELPGGVPRVRRPRGIARRHAGAGIRPPAAGREHDRHVLRSAAAWRLRRTPPGVETSMQAHNRQTLVERLANNEDDLYLFADAPEIDGRRHAGAPAQSSRRARPRRPSARARKEHPLRAPGQRALPHPRGRLGREADRDAALRLRTGSFRAIRMELGTNEAIKEAILAGLGVTIMSRYTFGLDPESSRYLCLDVEGFPLENHWYFAYPAGQAAVARWRGLFSISRRMEAKKLVLGSCAATATRSGCVGQGATLPRLSRTSARRRSPCRRSATSPGARKTTSPRSLVMSRIDATMASALDDRLSGNFDVAASCGRRPRRCRRRVAPSPISGCRATIAATCAGCTNMPFTFVVWSARPIQPLMRSVGAAARRLRPAARRKGRRCRSGSADSRC